MIKKIKNFPSYLKTIKDDLLHHIPNTRKNSEELVWAQIFNNTIAESSWLLNKSLSPGRWAVGYPGLYILYRIYNDIKPKQILEFGLGESSKLLIQYHKAFDSKITIVEHNQEWINFFSIANYNVSSFTKVLPLTEKKIQGKQTRTYANLETIYQKQHYDVIVIDGPYGSISFSRSQIIDLVENDCLKEEFIIVMDDYDRKGEIETMDKVEDLLRKKGIEFKTGIYEGQKKTYILCTQAYQYLCQL